MTPTRPRTLLLIGVIGLGVTWALLTVVYASLPPLTWTLVPALLIGAALEAWTGRDLRARIQGRPGAREVPLLFVARMVALAKASSQAAALLAGVSAGFVIYLSGMTDAPTPRADLVDASLSFGASIVLVAAALFLEYCCRVPNDPRADRDEDPPPPPSPFSHLSPARRRPPAFRARLFLSGRLPGKGAVGYWWKLELTTIRLGCGSESSGPGGQG